MINYSYEELFYDSNYRNLNIACDGSVIDNENICLESMKITESLASSNQIRFGEVIASEFIIKLISTDSYIGKNFDVSMIMNNDNKTRINLGKYQVQSDVPTADKKYRQIKAYDKLYDVIHTDVAGWYTSLTFPTTLGDMRTSLLIHLGFENMPVRLANDDMIIEKTMDVTTLSGADMLQAICELSGVFPKVNRIGALDFVFLAKDYSHARELPMFYRGEGAYQDYIVKPISKVTIKQSTGDVGTSVGTDGNTYYVSDNPLCYGKSADELREIATNLLNVIEGVSYQPFSVVTMGNPCYEVGDAIKVKVDDTTTLNTYILKRVLSGIQGLRDTFSAEGKEEYVEEPNSLISSISALKRTTNILIRDNEKTQSIISNMQVGGVNLIKDSELLQGLTAIEPIRDEDMVWITDENDVIIYD